MTIETTSASSPEDVLRAARDFFHGPHRVADAWIDSESEYHLSLCTFRGNLSIAAVRDPADPAVTRVRVSTLRYEGVVPRLMTVLEGLGARSAGV